MSKPDNELEQQLKKIGVLIEEKRNGIPKDADYLAVEVEIGFPAETEIDAPSFDVTIMNERGVKTHFTDFKILTRSEQKLIVFTAFQQTPDNIPLFGNFDVDYYSAYLDLCWKLGNNKVDDTVIPSVLTEPREGARHIDLGWVLPSRYIDSITHALGTLSNTILSNTIIEALVYGPYFFTKEEQA